MESVTEFKSLSEENLLPCSGSWHESLVSNVVDVLDRYDLILDCIEVIDERAVSCRTEKERIGLGSERLVIDVYRNCIGSLVLECKGDVVLHSVLCLISGLYFRICLFKEMLMLRRDCHNEVC